MSQMATTSASLCCEKGVEHLIAAIAQADEAEADAVVGAEAPRGCQGRGDAGGGCGLRKALCGWVESIVPPVGSPAKPCFLSNASSCRRARFRSARSFVSYSPCRLMVPLKFRSFKPPATSSQRTIPSPAGTTWHCHWSCCFSQSEVLDGDASPARSGPCPAPAGTAHRRWPCVRCRRRHRYDGHRAPSEKQA